MNKGIARFLTLVAAFFVALLLIGLLAGIIKGLFILIGYILIAALIVAGILALRSWLLSRQT